MIILIYLVLYYYYYICQVSIWTILVNIFSFFWPIKGQTSAYPDSLTFYPRTRHSLFEF
jgi:hypothetical protein